MRLNGTDVHGKVGLGKGITIMIVCSIGPEPEP